ncbi:filamentous hemagglutinin N-terminal domain-containing protein [Alcanivorax marinus]|uniref:Filamentous hemagglutinin N-terminal domain-containing protein n=1 Tax=Alloalcanivorax marinus TaxID=1177169 RepID=A0A9Q3YNC7_9GAMM|nr:filamentous hemagglutinin N-terminal domain-containing protein [Alloalcanivorax marinus]MCC4309647.1 filamentous hemagglutinin N-terminal domain-containing protein [Alloalcanivorax marinus]
MARNKKRNASVAVAVSVSVFGFSGAVHAGPSGGQVVQGDASITPNGVETIINQLSNKAVINWNDFSIDPGELVKFIHQASTDVTLNRVTGDTVSQIKGALTANGNIFLINPNGIVFGATAEIDVAGLLATTFDIADQDFMDGKLNFSGELMNDAAITNQGKIEVGNGGFVYLIAPNVENTGHIIANVGRVTLANDGSYDIDLTGNGLVTFSVTDADLTGATGSIKNGPDGKIEAGHVLLSGSQKDAVVSSVVNQGDITAATELTMAGDDLEQSGKLTVTGPEGEVRLQADNAITSTGGLIKGDTAVLQAGTGIGAAGAVSTEVDHLDVSSEAGAIRVDEVDQLASLKIDTGDDAEINLKHESQDPISGDPVFSDASVNFEGDRLSTSGIVETDLDFTHRDGRVTLNGVQVDGDLGVTAAGHILGNGDLDTAASGERVTLATTVDGATIGAESNPLRLDADTLRAEAQKGHVVITDTHGDLTLERVSTGDNSAEAGLRALITAEDGDLRGSNGAEANVEAWATNLKADGAIGADHQAVSTAVDVLSASTQDGGIYIDEQDGELMLGRVSAGERISQGGQTVSSTGIGGADGSVTLSNGAVGDHAVKIAAEDNILIGDRISSPDELWLFSRHGGIYKSGESAVITGRFIALDAAGRLGQDGAALSTQSNAIQARSGSDGIYLAEDNGLSALDIHAEGDNAEVQLTATRGDVLLGSVQADHGDVSVVSQDGDILGYAAAPFNVRGNHLTLDADGAIGTAAEALKTEVGSLTTTTGTSLAGTYVANTGLLSSLDATTLGGNVSVTDADGGVRFERANEHLAIERNSGQGLDLTVNNGAGNLIVEGADLSGHQVNLTASGRIGGDDKVLAADGLVLDAGDDIDLTTDANRIDATTADGDIDLDNQGTGELLLNASAGGADRGVAVTHKGDLKLGQVSADGLIRLTALGTLNGDGDSTAITGNYVELEAARIGSEARPLSTAITGELSMLSGGDIFVSNVGALSLLEGEAGGDIDFAQSGDAVLGRLASGGSVTFQASGRVSDGNGDDDNIVADDLNLSAQQVGAADGSVDALEIRVDELVVDTSNGGIYLRNRDNGPLSLIRARAAGGDVNIDSAGDIGLGTVTAAGGNVTLTSDGAINDARPDGADEANVVAGKVDMRARQGIGNTGPLVLDVDRMSVSGGNGDVNAASPGAVEVDADSLVGKGASGVTIVAASITVLDNNGGILVMDGGKLVLTATNGNIVFLNQDDTIRLPGGGSITLTARADGTNEGYNGNIITGNLVTEGGDITLDADRNVTLGMLDTGGTGDVYVIARDGVILDGNGADQNVRGDHVTLIGNTPSQRDAEIARDTAIADYAGRVAELNAKILQLEVLQQQLEAYLAALNQAIVNRNISQANLASAQARVNDLSRQLNAAQSTLNTLNRVVSVAQIAVDAMAMVAGGAQAIPFSGDGGAEATFQGLSLVLSAAQVAVDEYDRNTFSPLSDRFNVALNDLDVAKAYLGDAVTNVESWTTLRNTTRVSRDMADESVFKATAARDASQLLRQQSIAAYDQAQDIDMSAAKPLGIQANQLDMGTSSGRALNSGVYLDSTGNLGLGDIESVGEIRAENVAGTISVVGDVVSPTLISLQADGAVRGIGGSWVNGEWVADAGTLHAPAIAVRAGQGVADRGDSLRTDTDEIALDAGDGDAFVINDNGGDELVLGTVDGLSGMTASGDMGLANRGDLRLKTQVVDTDVTADSDTYLVAEGGAIIDDNGDTLNVTGGDLHFGADGQVELDTQVDRVVDSGTSDGDVLLRERDDLALIALETLNGDIDVTAGGNLTVHELAAGGDSATIRLDADGRIDDDQDNSTLIAGKRLELTAGGAIGATGSVTQRGLDTAVDVVTADAKGEINIHDQDDLDVEKVTTTTGNITVTSAAGDLRLGEVRTNGEGGNITLEADGAIGALNAVDETPELYADQLALRAGNGIGTADQSLLIETGALEADAGDGGLYLFNQNRDLTVGGVTPNLGLPGLTGLDANGDLHLTVADGALTLNEAVTQTGEGDTRLSSGKGQLINANLDAAGDLTLTASTGDISAINGVQLTSGGDLSATATEGGVSLVQNSRAQADGDLTLKGGTTVSLNNASAEAGGDLTLTGENGNVTLVHGQATGAEDVTVSAGDNITVSGVSTLTATNGALKATATEGNLEISSGSSASAATTLDLKAGNQVALNSATVQSGGDMSVTAEDGDVLLTSSRAATEGAQTVSAGGSVRLTQSQLNTETDGDMKVTATNGDISLNNSQMLAGGAFDGQAGGDAVLISGLISAGGSLNPEADPANGTLDLDAGGSVRLTQGSTLTGTGDTHVGAEAGELLVVDNGKILSGADIDLSAGTNATFNTGRATAGQDLTLTAGQNVSLSGGGNLTATDGDLSATATGGDVLFTQNSSATAGGDLELTAKGNTILTNALINAGVDLALTASQGSLRMTDSDAIAGGKLDASAGQDLQLAAGSTLIADGGTLNATATDGSLNMSQSSRAAATGDVALRAGTDLALNNATAESLEQNLSLTADTGSVTLVTSQGTARGDATVTAGENLVLSAGSALTATDGDLGLTATDGNLSVSQSSRLTAGNDLTGNAGTDLAFTTGTQATAGGDLDLDAGRHLTVEDSQVRADGDAALTATAGNLSVTRSTVTAGGFLDGDAGQGILLTAANLASGYLVVVPFAPQPDTNVDLTLNAGSGDIALSQGSTVASAGALVMDSDEGNVSLTNSSRATAVTDATVAAGASVSLAEGSRLEAGDGDLDITATVGDLTASQSSSLTAGNDLTGNAGTDVAFSTGATATAGGDLDLDAGRHISVEDAQARADGNASLTAATGNLSVSRSTVTAGGFLDGDAGGAVTLTSATLNSGLIDPAPAGNVDLTLNAGSGDLTFTDGSRATAAGDLVLGSEEGSIVLTNGSRAQAATDASLTAATDVRINNSSSVVAGEGDLTVTATGGDLSITSGGALTAGNDLTGTAGQNVTLDQASAQAGANLSLEAQGADLALANSQATAATDLVLKAKGDLTVDGSQARATDGNLSLTAGEGDLTVRQGSTLNAGADLTADAGNDLAFTSGTHAWASGDLDLGAGRDLTVSDATVRAEGTLGLAATDGDLAVTRASVTAAGVLTGSAGGAGTLTAATLTSGDAMDADPANLSLTVGGDLTVTDGTRVTASDSLTLGSDDGAVLANNGSALKADRDVTVTAGTDVDFDNASLDAVDGNARITATDGDLTLAHNAGLSAGADLDASAGGKLTMDATSAMNSGADLTLDAVDDVALSTLRAGGDVSVTSEEGGIQADPAIAEHIHGDNLFLSAAKSIGSTLSGLKTRVTQLYATITGSGDLHLEDLDTNGLTVKDSSLADGDAHLRAGGGLTIDALAVNGDAVLDSAGRLATSAEGTLSADDLQGTAVNGIRLDSSLQSATLAVTGTGAIDLDNQGDLRLDGATTADGDINVDNGGDLGIGRVDAGDHDVALSADGAIRKDGAGEVEGVNVTLRANDGIGEWATDNPTDGFLNLTAGRIDALSVAGDLVLNQQGPVLISQARTGDGRVGLMVENGDATLGDIHAQGQVTVVANAGKLIDDGDANTRVVGDEVRLGGRDGVGTDTTAIATRANTLDLRAENGVINVEEQDGLAGLNAHIDNGDIRVRTLTGDLTVNEVRALTPGNAVMLSAVAGAILDGNAEATNIVASLLELTAATGIARASDPLDVDVQTLGATGGSGGVYINNRGTGPLTVTGLTGQGGLGLTTGGDLDLDGDLDGRRVDLSAGGDLTQRGRITGTDGVSVSGNGDVTMATGAETGSTGQVRYRAGQTLTVDRIHTTTGLGGGTVILEGRDLASNATGSGSIRAGEVRVRVLNVDSDRVYEMVDTTDGKARVSLNDRTLGGKVVEDTQYVADLTAPQSVMPRLVFEPFEPLRPADGLGFQPPADDSDEWRYQP